MIDRLLDEVVTSNPDGYNDLSPPVTPKRCWSIPSNHESSRRSTKDADPGRHVHPTALIASHLQER